MIWLKRLSRLTPQDWVSIVAAYWWLLKARWQMRHLQGKEWLEGPTPRRKRTPVSTYRYDAEKVARQVRFINHAGRYPYRWASCLQCSLALREWLARDGVLAGLRIGVQWNERGEFCGHAWLEYGGEVLNDRVPWVEKFAMLRSVDSGELVGKLPAQRQGDTP